MKYNFRVLDSDYEGYEKAIRTELDRLEPVLDESLAWIKEMDKKHPLKDGESRNFGVRFYFQLEERTFEVDFWVAYRDGRPEFFIRTEDEQDIAVVTPMDSQSSGGKD